MDAQNHSLKGWACRVPGVSAAPWPLAGNCGALQRAKAIGRRKASRVQQGQGRSPIEPARFRIHTKRAPKPLNVAMLCQVQVLYCLCTSFSYWHLVNVVTIFTVRCRIGTPAPLKATGSFQKHPDEDPRCLQSAQASNWRHWALQNSQVESCSCPLPKTLHLHN